MSNNSINISDVINSNYLPAIATVFFNIGRENKNGFTIDSTYSVTKYAPYTEFNDLAAKENNDLLSAWTGLPFKVVTSTKNQIRHRLLIINDLKLTREEILSKMYTSIQRSRIELLEGDKSLETFKSTIVMALFVLRGSIDIKANFFSVDLLNVNVIKSYIKNLFEVITSIDINKQLNLNFRELQGDYAKGKKRNTQIRINLKFLYTEYYSLIRKINVHKALLMENNKQSIELKSIGTVLDDNFSDRYNFYINYILGNKYKYEGLNMEAYLEEQKILRNLLGFNDIISEERKRNSDIVNIAKDTLEDECVCCKDDYKIFDRTFKYRDTEKPYLEIHHVVSFSSSESSDTLANLVKVCPACHRALTPRRAKEEYQKYLIKNILKNSPVTKEFVKAAFDKNYKITEETLINYVYERLR